jgi:processing peptidase subunit alpha
LNNYGQIESFSAFSSIYNNSGLFGIHATTNPDFVSSAVDLAARELHEVATPGKGFFNFLPQSYNLFSD